jgi:hypothetical protein
MTTVLIYSRVTSIRLFMQPSVLRGCTNKNKYGPCRYCLLNWINWVQAGPPFLGGLIYVSRFAC